MDKELAKEMFEIAKSYVHGFGHDDFKAEASKGNVSTDLYFVVKSLGWSRAVDQYVVAISN
jgi:hypothetical protein